MNVKCCARIARLQSLFPNNLYSRGPLYRNENPLLRFSISFFFLSSKHREHGDKNLISLAAPSVNSIFIFNYFFPDLFS